ncbi:hypothetical protein C0Q70_18717 [Pomacea canaliculata]|uniref:Centrosomal protein of 89 kDa n=1 Tax=Pomacea canaliculata TaxID=400727 RepID=A0A2T7NHB4_POMCA|nr:centrosomal protein of 89 kDa-like isoform X2 [Pomacea canaliculata]PVD20561.1 hypothetical protein C0Q70_18717 [Pomacea canaliculata]
MLRKGRKKPNTIALEKIGPALIPRIVFAAVPRSPPPKAPSGTPLGLASAVFGASYVGRAMGEPSQEGTADPLSDPESSLYDYQQMAEPGYSTVGFRAGSNQNRISYSDRDRAPTPPFVKNAASVGVVSQSGELYHILEPEDGQINEDLYSVPLRKKGPGTKMSKTRESDDAISMDRTRRDVQKAMQAVHDMPVEETILKQVENQQQLTSYPSSSSGRGTMRRDFESGSIDQIDNEVQDEVDAAADENFLLYDQKPQDREEAYVYLKQELQSQGNSQSRDMPSDISSLGLEIEVHRLKEENEQLQEEVLNLRNVTSALKVGDREGAEMLLRDRQIEELKAENEVMKNAVHRINVELSQYQAKYRPLSEEEQSRLQGLPSTGPVPSWLINRRYLAPLFLAYDDLIQEKENFIYHCQEELQTLKKRTAEVIKENEQFHLKVSGKVDNNSLLKSSEWHQLQDQARLVLEENQILIEQLNIQKNKVKDLCSNHARQVGQLTKKMNDKEMEKEELEQELEKVKKKLQDIKHKYDQMLLDTEGHMPVHDHITMVADLKRTVSDEKEKHEKEKEVFSLKLMASEEERKHQTLKAIEVSAENRQLKAEIKSLHKALRKAQNKIMVLHKAVEQSENKELITQNELANVIRIVEQTALERDTAFQVVKEQQQDCKETVDRMVSSGVVRGKLEERLKMYKIKAFSKLQMLADKLKEQDESFNRQRQEYEREIRYLRLVIKEKEDIINSIEGAKREVEEDLETMWQAATSENQRLKDTLRNSIYKLKEHSSLKAALEDEKDLDDFVNFSDHDG